MEVQVDLCLYVGLDSIQLTHVEVDLNMNLKFVFVYGFAYDMCLYNLHLIPAPYVR